MSNLAVAQEFDTEKAEAFGARMLDVINHGVLNVVISIGHQTGLFDTLASLPPSTSDEIASAAKLNERYVREWLGAMVTAKIVEYDGAGKKYWLPVEHAPLVTRAGGADNMAFFTQYVTVFGSVEQKLIGAFRNGGGVGYEDYPGFQKLQAEETARVYDTKLISTVLPLVPNGIARLREGIRVADVGCGAGHALNLMAREFPNSTFTGYDFSSEGISRARAEARSFGLQNVRFEVRDVAEVEVDEPYDLITAFDMIHDQAKPRVVLRRIAAALAPGGVFLMADIKASSDLANNIDHPLGPVIYSYSVLHCMTVSLAQGGEGLGTAWGQEQACELLAEAGFQSVDVKDVEGDILNSYYIVTK